MFLKDVLQNKKGKIIKDYQNGKSACQLGREFGCSGASVYLFLRDDCGIKMRQITSLDEFKDSIVELHSQGYSNYKIAKTLDLPTSTTSRYIIKLGLKRNGTLKRRNDLIKNHEQEILAKYNNGIGCYKLAKEYNCAESSILKLLKRNSVEIRGPRKYDIEEDYFEKIDTWAKAYILGFLYADGSNSGTYIRTSICDREVLEFMQKEIGQDVPIYQLSQREDNWKIQYNIDFSSGKICRDLTDLGCMKGKTYIIEFPTFEQVPQKFISAFLLGLLDGDGTITKNSNRDSWNVKYAGTLELMNGIKFFIKTFYSISSSVYQSKQADSRIGCCSICGKNDVKRFLDWLYKNHEFCLKRKYDKYQEFLSDYQNS